MKIYFPNNFFTRLLVRTLPDEIKCKVSFLPASLISKELNNSGSAAGLIPTLDLIKNRDFFVSKCFGVSFEGSFCNSYIYFKPERKDISEINLFGDVSSLEVILGKIIFKEIYGMDINIQITIDEDKIEKSNIILIGDKNFEKDRFKSGVSFSEEIIEMISLPFVNYVFASKEEGIVKEVNEITRRINQSIYDKIETGEFGKNFSESAKSCISENISSLVINFDPNDIEGIKPIIEASLFSWNN